MHVELKRYQQAATTLLRQGEDVKLVLEGAKKAMARRGHAKLYPALLRGLVRVYPRIEAGRAAKLVVAKEEDGQLYAKRFGRSETNITVDPTIVGGYVYVKDHVREDNSYKQKLLTWYRRATSTN